MAAFVALLVASACELSLGFAEAANSLGVYAFYSLVIGVILQIGSYAKSGETEPDELASPEKEPAAPFYLSWSRRKKVITAAILVTVVLGTGTAVIYPGTPHRALFEATYPKLSVALGYTSTLSEPDGSTVVAFGINARGGSLPYTFTARWPDNITQISSAGAFSRVFLSNQTILLNASVTVGSGDGQRATIQIGINPNGQ